MQNFVFLNFRFLKMPKFFFIELKKKSLNQKTNTFLHILKKYYSVLIKKMPFKLATICVIDSIINVKEANAITRVKKKNNNINNT